MLELIQVTNAPGRDLSFYCSPIPDTRRAQTARLIILPKTLVEIGSVQTPNPLRSDILNILVIMRYIFMEI